MAQRPSRSSREPVPEKQRQQLARLVRDAGEQRAMEVAGIKSRHTFARLLAGLTVTAGTRALIQQGLASLEGRP